MKVTIAVLFACIAVAAANYGGYGHEAQHYIQPMHHQIHSYPAHPPKVECGHSLLFSCQPSTAHVPCHPSHKSHGYGHAAPAQHSGYKAPAKY